MFMICTNSGHVIDFCTLYWPTQCHAREWPFFWTLVLPFFLCTGVPCING
jgi:hypothetical protein